MSSISTIEAQQNFTEIVNRTSVKKERVVLTDHGKDIAALIPLEDLKLLEMIEDQIDLHDAKLSLKEAKEKGTISLDTLKALLKNEKNKN